MLDLTTFRAQLDAATGKLTTTLAELLSEEVKRLQLAAEAEHEHNTDEPEPKARPVPASVTTRAPTASSQPAPLSRRPNVHVIPSEPKPLPLALVETDTAPKGPSPEEIAQKTVRIVASASLPPTFERLRRSLRVTKAALAPVVDQLVEDNKICVVEVGDVILYKPPRIEPIRRRRAERAAANA